MTSYPTEVYARFLQQKQVLSIAICFYFGWFFLAWWLADSAKLSEFDRPVKPFFLQSCVSRQGALEVAPSFNMILYRILLVRGLQQVRGFLSQRDSSVEENSL